MKHYRRVSALFLLFMIWYLFANQVQNDFILPYPRAVLQAMGSQLASQAFYASILATMLRCLLGLLIAFLTAFIAALASYRYKLFEELFYPMLLLARSVPNVCYIIIIQLWFGREISSAIITYLILFPILYANLKEGLLHLPKELLHVLQIYPERFGYTVLHIYLPMLRAAMIASLLSGLSLGFKVGVMSEILGQVQTGIGRQLNLCRLSFDMTGVFAWTGWIVILLLLFELIFYAVLHRKKDIRTQ